MSADNDDDVIIMFQKNWGADDYDKNDFWEKMSKQLAVDCLLLYIFMNINYVDLGEDMEKVGKIFEMFILMRIYFVFEYDLNHI